MHISCIRGLLGRKGSHTARIWGDGVHSSSSPDQENISSALSFSGTAQVSYCREHREGMGHRRPCESCTLRKHSELERRHGGSPHSP